jgi:GT2 family glycosyltransferase
MSVEESPSLAIIIVTYQRPSALERLLDSVAGQDIPRETYEICVVDNGCDLPREALSGHTVDHWVRPESNIGASAGRNRGVAATRAPLMLFLDDDGVVAEGTLRAAQTAFERDPSVMAARGRVLPLDHPVLSSIASHYDRGAERCPDWLIIEGMTAIRREAYEAVEGYDPALFGHEGIELSFRLIERFPEGEICYLPNMVLHHDFASSWAELWSKARRMARASDRTPKPVVERARAAYRACGFSYPGSGLSRVFSWIPRTVFRQMVGYHRWRGRKSQAPPGHD